jgi:hypothetical protein
LYGTKKSLYFSKGCGDLREAAKSISKEDTSTLNRSTPDDDTPDAAGDSWISKLRK